MKLGKFSRVAVALLASAVFYSCSSTTVESSGAKIDKSMIGNGGEEGMTDFYVASVSPNEEVPSSVSFPSIQIQFSKPVVALAKLGEPITSSDVVTITPKLNGVFRWYGTSLLSFDTSDALIPQKEYYITVNPELTAADGTQISGPVCFTFHTEELKLKSIEPGYTAKKQKKIYLNSYDMPPEYATDMAVNFSNKVNPSVISEYLSIKDSDGKDYKFKASAIQEKSVLLKFDQEFPRNKKITVTLKEGAVPDKDCWPTSIEQNRDFHTLLPFQFNDVYGTSNLSISFNHQIKAGTEKQIFEAISFSPKMNVDISQLELKGNTVYIRDIPVTYNDTYTITVKEGAVVDTYDQIYNQKISKKITVPDADSFVTFRTNDLQIIEAQFEPKTVFEYQNIDKESSYTITPISGANDSFKLPKAKTFTFKTNKENKNRRVIQTVELKDFLQNTPSGYRGALKFESLAFTNNTYSKDKYYERKTTSYILVTDLAITATTSWNETVVLVTKLSTGEPVPNATVNIRAFKSNDDYRKSMLSSDGSILGSATTDQNGMAVVHFTSDNSISNLIRYIEASTADDKTILRLSSYLYGATYTAAEIKDGNIISTDTNKEIKESAIVKPNNVTKIFSDRGLYRPGEKASFKIIDRTLALGKYSTYTGPYEIEIKDSTYWRNDSKAYSKVTGKMSEEGTTSIEWELPEDLKPGYYYLIYKRTDGSNLQSQSSINVQFFERLRFQASAEITPVVYYRGDTISAKVTASYLGGGSLAGGSVRSDWYRSYTSFTPAGEQYKGYTFGPITWRAKYYSVYDEDSIEESDNYYESDTVNLSPDGTAILSATTGTEPKAGTPYSYNLQAQVTDAGNQMIAARASTIVHPASFYIGLSGIQNIKGFAKKGEKLTFNYLLATPEGEKPEDKLLSKDQKISWELTKDTWVEETKIDEYGYEYSDWVQKTITEASGSVSAKSTELTITPKDGGTYYLSLKTTDSKGRAVITERSFYVTGSTAYRRNDNSIQLNLMCDRNEYEPGETAHIQVECPLEKGYYLVTVEREGILSEKVVKLEKSGTTLDIPIEDWYVPLVYVSVSTYTARDGEPPADYYTKDEHKPRCIYAKAILNISTKSKQFDVDVTMDKKSYLPGSNAKIDLSATKKGKPVANAEITLMVVDRGVLDLIGYRAGNPIYSFWSMGLFSDKASTLNNFSNIVDPVTYGTYTISARELELLIEKEKIMYESAVMAKGVNTASARASAMADDMYYALDEAEEMKMEDSADGGAEENIQIRNDFRATAVFLPNLKTDANGKVSTEFKLPDSLTEYVVTVVGVKENDYAYKEDALTVANPISVRDVKTRILRPGDNGEAGVVITNIGDTDENVTVEFSVLSGLDKTSYKAQAGDIARIPGQASVSGESKKSLVVKSGDTSTLMFRLDAQSQGWITLAFRVKSSSVNEMIYKPLEIEKPYIYETVTTVGQIDADENSVQEKIIFPTGNDDGRATFYVQLDATRLGALRSAVDYVFRYPYGCLEQRSSATLPLIAFGDYISVFGLQSEVTDPRAVVEKEIASWADVQKSDGGFPYWPDGKESSFAVSLRIAEIITLAKEHGITLPKNLNQKKLVSYIQKELNRLEEKGWWYPKAYSYYVLARMGEKVPSSKIKEILDMDTGVSEYALAGLAAVELKDKENAALAVKKIKNLMSLTTRGASFQNSVPFAGWYFYNSNPERYALALHLFTKVDADDIYNGHLVWQLLELEKGNGRWNSTATTSRVLMALDAYIRTNKLQDTNLTAEILVNGKSILSGNLKGAGAQPVEKTYRFGEMATNTKSKDEKFDAKLPKLDVPLEQEVPLQINKSGTGKLYYTASMTYALPADEQKARDEGLCVYVEITDARTGEKVDGNKLKSGTIYREKVFITSTKERTYVAVRAPIPAGCEILNPAFQTTGTVEDSNKNQSSGKRIWWIPQWRMSHQDIYDAEVRCFWDYIPIGSQSFEFTFRAQRDGAYETPATLAECMYEPEIFGRSNGKRWIVEK